MFYGTAAGYKAYFLARERDIPISTDEEIEGSLLVASEWIDATFRSGFGGLKVGGREQIREWPRTGAMDIYGYSLPSDSVPIEVINATYEAAAQNIISPGSLTVNFSPPKYKRVSIDGAVSVEWAGIEFASDAQMQLQTVNNTIAPVLTSNPMFPLASRFSGPGYRV